MKTIKEFVKVNQTINRSEFITSLYPVSSIEEVQEILQNVRKTYYDATHNCYAYILGLEGDQKKASDDGEPSGTSGMPILGALEKNDLTNVLCIVTRYFGGIKLGAGGLVRAYSSSASLGVNSATLLTLTKVLKIEITTSYQQVNVIMKTLANEKLYDKKFLEEIYLYYEVKYEDFDKITKDLTEISKNQAKIIILEEVNVFI